MPGIAAGKTEIGYLWLLAALLVLTPASLYAHGAHCVENSLEIVDAADGDYIVAKGGAVQVDIHVRNCGTRREAIRSKLLILDTNHNRIAQLTHTDYLGPEQSRDLSVTIPIPLFTPDLEVCYLLRSRTVAEPVARAESDLECIEIVDP